MNNNMDSSTASEQRQPGRNRKTLRRFAFEFLSIFIAVISAFALNNWNDDRRDRHTERKLLSEIENGLVKDKLDIEINAGGHHAGIQACDYWQQVIENQPVADDSIYYKLLNLTRDFISIQNRAGYESLKSKGLELIRNDSLRVKIITFYEYDFATLKALEEEYDEMQFHRNYFKDLNTLVSSFMTFDERGNLTGMVRPVELTKKEKNLLLLDLWKIRVNRYYALAYYREVNQKIDGLIEQIRSELNDQS